MYIITLALDRHDPYARRSKSFVVFLEFQGQSLGLYVCVVLKRGVRVTHIDQIKTDKLT